MTDKIKLERRGHTALITIDNPAANTGTRQPWRARKHDRNTER